MTMKQEVQTARSERFQAQRAASSERHAADAEQHLRLKAESDLTKAERERFEVEAKLEQEFQQRAEAMNHV